MVFQRISAKTFEKKKLVRSVQHKQSIERTHSYESFLFYMKAFEVANVYFLK